MTWFVRTWLCLIVISSSQALGTLAFRNGSNPTTFIWTAGGKAHYRLCLVPAFDEAKLRDFEKTLLAACNADAGKKEYNFPESVYVKSLNALYGVPSNTFQSEKPEEALFQGFMERERLFRQEQPDQITDQTLEMMLVLNEEIIQYLPLSEAKIAERAEKTFGAIRYSAVRGFTSTYSNGRIAANLGKSVTPSQLWEACDDGWGPLSAKIATYLLSNDREEFIRWYASVNPSANGQVITWSHSVTPKKVRDGSTGYVKEIPTTYYSLSDGSSKQTGNYSYPTICIRRELPRARRSLPFDPSGTLSLVQISQRYKLSPQGFYSRILEDDDLELAFADFYLSEGKMPEEAFEKHRPAVEKLLAADKPDWSAMEATAVAEEKRQVQLAQEAKVRAVEAEKTRLRNLIAEREAAAARSSSAPLYAKRSNGDGPGTRYYDSDGFTRISKEEHDQMQNTYNLYYYGRYIYDLNGNPIRMSEYNQLNR